jgi:N4-(beta-N-acetylglucosaminyl)-L-asparaginase
VRHSLRAFFPRAQPRDLKLAIDSLSARQRPALSAVLFCMHSVFIASWNGAPATQKAHALHAAGTPLLDAIVAGIELVEDDPAEFSVGFGGLPNEDGEVELDAAVMEGPSHRAGAVAGLRRVRRAARLALEVMRRTDHTLLVGDGALAFARKLGYIEENLLTREAREAWLAWKASLSTKDAWIGPDEVRSAFDTARWAGHKENPTPGGPQGMPPALTSSAQPHIPGPGSQVAPPRIDLSKPASVPFTYGTIHVSGRDSAGNLASCTSTSGLSYKIAGRVGDSPIVGSGLYTDNAVGSAGATGRGEASMLSCASYDVVRGMEAGLSPTQACVQTLRRIAQRTKDRRLLDDAGNPTFNVSLYALRKDGEVGAAALHKGYQHVVQQGSETVVRDSVAVLA